MDITTETDGHCSPRATDSLTGKMGRRPARMMILIREGIKG